MIRITLFNLLASLLLACGLSSTTAPATQNEQVDIAPLLVPDEVSDETYFARLVFHGDSLIEEKVLDTGVIVRAIMTSFSSEVVAATGSKYHAALKFNLTVREYLQGTGPSKIVAVWVDGYSYDTHKKAEDQKAVIVANRDTQWDGREAVVFLSDGPIRLGTALDTELQKADHFFLSGGDPYSADDRYSLHSETNKLWLPAVTSGSSGASVSDDNKRFLLDIPSASEGVAGASSSATTPSITLGNLKKRIAAVTAEFNGGDGSPAYKECIQEKYRHERGVRYFKELDGSDFYDKSPVSTALASGQPANTTLYQGKNYGNYPSQKAKTWFEGADAALFSVVQGKTTPYDVDGDGKFTAVVDGIEFTETLTTARPLPAGTYKVNRREVWAVFLPCNFILDHDWTITITAPAGTVHEAFFDPVSITTIGIGGGGTTIGADIHSGVLKPRAFTGAGGVSASLRSLGWQSGKVKLVVAPPSALTGYMLDFIGTDGKVTRSLRVSDATVHAASNSLSWSVATAPWKAGDKLMLRIRPAPAATPTPTPVPKAKATPTPAPKPTPPPKKKATPTPNRGWW